MKKITQTLIFAAGCFLMSSAAFAQSKALYLSSVSGTKVSQYDGQSRNITMYRNVYTGWNTLCVPFSLSADELNATFGTDCRLETLQSIDNVDGTIYLRFTDVKSEGVKANTPYLLYYTGEAKSVKVSAEDAVVEYKADASVSFKSAGATVKFTGAQTHLLANGQYGIYVRDNAEANFAVVEPETSGFYATRCYITVEGVQDAKLISLHGNDATAIKSVATGNADGSEIYGLNGVRQNNIQKGVNVVGGKKVLVK